MDTSVSSPDSSTRLAELRVPARGWHGIQLAVIGFVGLCGVLKRDSNATPTWLEVWAGILALAALALSCFATYLVGRAAWPIYGAHDRATAGDDAGELERTSRRLKQGLLLTFVAVGLLALGSASSWWPSDDGDDASGSASASVQVQAEGRSFCGRLADAPAGVLALETADRPVQIRVAALTSVRSVDGC